jgi:hypothetical protein
VTRERGNPKRRNNVGINKLAPWVVYSLAVARFRKESLQISRANPCVLFANVDVAGNGIAGPKLRSVANQMRATVVTITDQDRLFTLLYVPPPHFSQKPILQVSHPITLLHNFYRFSCTFSTCEYWMWDSCLWNSTAQCRLQDLVIILLWWLN